MDSNVGVFNDCKFHQTNAVVIVSQVHVSSVINNVGFIISSGQ